MKIASVVVTLVRDRVTNDEGVPCDGNGKRIIFYPEGGMQIESFTNGIGWCSDNDALTDEQCCDILASVGSVALGISAKVA